MDRSQSDQIALRIGGAVGGGKDRGYAQCQKAFSGAGGKGRKEVGTGSAAAAVGHPKAHAAQSL